MTARIVLIAALAAASSVAWSPGVLVKQATTVMVPQDPAHMSVGDIVGRVQSTYDAMQDFEADFVQRYTNEALGDTDVSTGHLFFLKPGMMRWDYAEPIVRHFISDGTDFWIYEPAEAQYFTQPLDDSDLPTALRFLMGSGRLTDDFEVTISSQTSDRVELRLVPLEDEGEYDELLFVVDPTDWHVAEVVIYDPIGNTNHLIFTNTMTGIGHVPANFVFVPPPGTRQVEDPMGG